MITLTSDFGLKDPYVAEMKGAILTINPNATIVDITHGVEKFNIRMGAFMLASAAPYFPKGTVHLAVVDPGVGTERHAILVQTKKGFFVGPDNGLLILAAQTQGIEHTYELTNPKFMLPKVSSTFHGRDVFAPAAAHLDKSAKPSEFGPEIHDLVKPEFASVKQRSDSLTGEVLHVDGFGNIITNISEKDLTQNLAFKVKLTDISLNLVFGKTYAQAKPQEPIALVGSHGFLEIALNQASAAEKLHAKTGDKVEVTPA
ncbi:MAG: S-adenosyl-l-methionine hydroxide adenosyltransferase family protein [Candidatus Bathyarchaeota archaeon]|nr:S-adenosyl-l-methionine hydroxide adenosyltransferase family protein [Candidatus Bathyarchaeota archaeon]